MRTENWFQWNSVYLKKTYLEEIYLEDDYEGENGRNSFTIWEYISYPGNLVENVVLEYFEYDIVQ